MCLDLTATETVLLFGAPVAAKREEDSFIRLVLSREDFRTLGTADWVVYAELADMKVVANPSDAARLAARVMARNADDGLLASESLILDRRAEVLAEAAKTASARD
jgi:hypothetical protein